MPISSLLAGLKALLDSPSPAGEKHPLEAAVAAQLPAASEEARQLVAAVAGLFACLVYADAEYSPAEQRKVREALGRIEGLTEDQAEAIAAVLRAEIGAITSAGDQRWVRDLKQLTDREQRLELLEVLMELAAADEDFSLAETNYLRRLATALGLSQADYVGVQSRFREHLGILR